jgi:hypothetical protein
MVVGCFSRMYGRELDPSLEPILAQQVVRTGVAPTQVVIQIGDKSLSYNNSFKFFMTTTMPNPHYSPETSVKVTIINFAITPERTGRTDVGSDSDSLEPEPGAEEDRNRQEECCR